MNSKVIVTILSCLSILCTSDINAMIGGNEKSKLESCYLAILARHLESKDSLRNFLCVSKKCNGAVDHLHLNDVPMSYEDAKKFHSDLETFTVFKTNSYADLLNAAEEGKILNFSEGGAKVFFDSWLLKHTLNQQDVLIWNIEKINDWHFTIGLKIPSEEGYSELECNLKVPVLLGDDFDVDCFGYIVDILYKKVPELARQAGLKRIFNLTGMESIFGKDKTVLEEIDFNGCFAVNLDLNRGCLNARNKLQSVVIPKCMFVNKYAFGRSQGLLNLVVKDNAYLGSGSFNGCLNLRAVKIGNDCKIDYYTFRDCPSLQTVIIGDNCEINYGAFQHCSNLQNIIMGNNCIINNDGYFNGSEVFAGCTNLRNVTIDGRRLSAEEISNLIK